MTKRMVCSDPPPPAEASKREQLHDGTDQLARVHVAEPAGGGLEGDRRGDWW